MSESISTLLEKVPIPQMFQIQQDFERPRIEPARIPFIISDLYREKQLAESIRPGMRIAITAGSRGIANVALITKSIVNLVKDCGAEPFVVPAMGSHGGATAEGQLEVLAGYGITKESMNCPILSSMEVVKIGVNDKGMDVFIDKHAAGADGIIVSCRIKPHTCFRGPYESGIMKMMTIGLGKQAGAEICHSAGFKYMAEYVPLFGRTILKNAPILFAVAALENAFDETSEIAVLRREEIEPLEPEYLEKARRLLPKIAFDECDVLICDVIGKNFSGSGMDPNITGTFPTPYASGGIKSQRVAVLDLSGESHGNGMGAGSAHASTQRLFKKFKFDKTYANAITSTVVENARLPCIFDNDREAIQFCLRTCNEIDMKSPKVIRIKNTMELEYIWVSKAYWEQAKNMPGVRVVSKPMPMHFDRNGNLF